jgi:hypothetical protein
VVANGGGSGRYQCTLLPIGRLTEKQGEYQAALAHYRAGQAALGPEEARACIRRCVEAVVRAKQEEQEERKGE